ncbi:Hypp5323 [Branchiostoma lanceolatum]|uniref:Hypp5323 protein n=1 Tax=Branchiostoma lanceolatum TaxID=7740 RepID=A0A8K0AFF1_BRALA|nr:Hypp5323 [Branchiostoma lanceolatum]
METLLDLLEGEKRQDIADSIHHLREGKDGHRQGADGHPVQMAPAGYSGFFAELARPLEGNVDRPDADMQSLDASPDAAPDEDMSGVSPAPNAAPDKDMRSVGLATNATQDEDMPSVDPSPDATQDEDTPSDSAATDATIVEDVQSFDTAPTVKVTSESDDAIYVNTDKGTCTVCVEACPESVAERGYVICGSCGILIPFGNPTTEVYGILDDFRLEMCSVHYPARHGNKPDAYIEKVLFGRNGDKGTSQFSPCGL